MMKNINLNNPYNGCYLAHHGILGQKWGKQNGPPYPLGAEDHSKAEKKAGYRKSLGGGRNEELYGRKTKPQVKTSPKSTAKGLTENQKTAIKVAAIGIAAAAGTYALYKSGAIDEFAKFGENSVKNIMSGSGNTPIDTISDSATKAFSDAPKIPKATIQEAGKRIAEQCGFKLKTVGMSSKEDAKAINPNYLTTKWATDENCGYAAMGWCLRRLGIDIKIKDGFEGAAFHPSVITDFFSNHSVKFPRCSTEKGTLDPSSVDGIKNSLRKAIMDKYHPVDGHVGMIGMLPLHSDSGHYLSWEMLNGQIVFFDPQSHGMKSPEHYFKHVVSGAYDNASIAFNDFSEAVANAEMLKEIFESQ